MAVKAILCLRCMGNVTTSEVEVAPVTFKVTSSAVANVVENAFDPRTRDMFVRVLRGRPRVLRVLFSGRWWVIVVWWIGCG